MPRFRLLAPAALTFAAALALAACGSDSPYGSAATTAASGATPTTTATTAASGGDAPYGGGSPTTTAAAAAAGGTTVSVAQTSLGSVLVDDTGMTLYLFTKDSPNTTTCTDDCLVAWPALEAVGTPTAGDGVDASKLGTMTRPDGTTQVTYAGWPMYFYAKDKAPGDTTGQGVGGVWFAVLPTGAAAG